MKNFILFVLMAALAAFTTSCSKSGQRFGKSMEPAVLRGKLVTFHDVILINVSASSKELYQEGDTVNVHSRLNSGLWLIGSYVHKKDTIVERGNSKEQWIIARAIIQHNPLTIKHEKH